MWPQKIIFYNVRPTPRFTMPFKSAKQKRAMYAAASGKSNIGISKKAAKKFIAHSKPKKKRRPKKRKS
jgi:hypothetical protein